MDQPIRAKQAPASALWRDMTRQLHRDVESIFRKCQEFSQKLTNISQNFSDNYQNNQNGTFAVLQEEELERQKSQKVNKNTLKLSINYKDMVDYLQ